jgi:hypothetical protein
MRNVDAIVTKLQEARHHDAAAQALRREAAGAVIDLQDMDRKRVAQALGMDTRSLDLLAAMAGDPVTDGTRPRRTECQGG